MKTSQKIVIAAVIAMIALIPSVLVCESADAATNFDHGDIAVTKAFDDMSGGTVSVPVTNKTDAVLHVTVTIKDVSGKNTYSSSNFEIPANNTSDCALSWNFGSSGDKRINISVSDGTNTESFQRTISVSHSIWKDPITYIAIVVAVIIIAILIFVKMRATSDAKAKSMKGKKEEKIFTKMAEEKKNAKVTAPKTQNVTAEKKIYEGSKRGRK